MHVVVLISLGFNLASVLIILHLLDERLKLREKLEKTNPVEKDRS